MINFFYIYFLLLVGLSGSSIASDIDNDIELGNSRPVANSPFKAEICPCGIDWQDRSPNPSGPGPLLKDDDLLDTIDNLLPISPDYLDFISLLPGVGIAGTAYRALRIARIMRRLLSARRAANRMRDNKRTQDNQSSVQKSLEQRSVDKMDRVRGVNEYRSKISPDNIASKPLITPIPKPIPQTFTTPIPKPIPQIFTTPIPEPIPQTFTTPQVDKDPREHIFTKDEADKWSREPQSLQDQMALEAAKRGEGTHLKDIKLGDPRYKGMYKMELKIKSDLGKDSVIHYILNPKTGELMDFKFKKHSTD